MMCLVLAAGYATRLYPLTENFPKPLLCVGGKTILDHLLDDIEASGGISEYVIISNHKFISHFEEWAKSKPYNITLLDDGTSTNETRLGAVCDIQLAIEKLKLDDELLIIAGDNLLDFSLCEFISYAKRKSASCIMRYYEESEQRLLKCGVVELDENDRILSMTEKSATPASHWCTPPFYFYTRADIRLIKSGIEAGCGTDAPGSLAAWLSTQTDMYAMEMHGKRYDIGDIDSYNAVKAKYTGINE